MAEEKGNGTSRAEQIQAEINDAFKELDQIRKAQTSITSPADLEAAERAITKVTDKLAALMTALKIQQAVDSVMVGTISSVEILGSLGTFSPKFTKFEVRTLPLSFKHDGQSQTLLISIIFNVISLLWRESG